ncbi:MAG: glycosyl hydrolase [Taibaiella sp.]|jgi:mannan endo-1,4-beta-mannosidase
MKRILGKNILVILFLLAYGDMYSQNLVDKNAMPQTRNLYANLSKMKGDKILFGQHDDPVVGASRSRGVKGSDIYDIINDYPAIYGFDLGFLELGKEKNCSAESCDKIRTYIKEIYERGGIITLSWHLNNPVMPSENVKSKLVKNTISSIFTDSLTKKRYNSWLDKVAGYISSLKSKKGISIPVLFRPFHENNGNWFWWGGINSSNEDYVKLWKYTVDYLRNVKKVHNIIYVYSTDKFSTSEAYFKKYPGDDYVDILGFDCYDGESNYPQNKMKGQLRSMIKILSGEAKKRKKLFALTETGFKQMPIADWWTNTLMASIKGTDISYVLLWGNYNLKSYWSVFKGQKSEQDFKEFSKAPEMIFQSKLSRLNIYGK